MSALIGLICAAELIGVHYFSSFDFHSTAIVLVLLMLIPVLMAIFGKAERERLDIDPRIFLLFLVLIPVEPFLSYLAPFHWSENPIKPLLWFLVPLIILVAVSQVPTKRLGFRGLDARTIASTVLVCLIYGMMVFLMIGHAEIVAAAEFLLEDVTYVLSRIPWAVLVSIPILFMLAALPEEFLFRTVIQTSLTERIGPILGILVSSLLFGLVHIPLNYTTYLMVTGSPEMQCQQQS